MDKVCERCRFFFNNDEEGLNKKYGYCDKHAQPVNKTGCCFLHCPMSLAQLMPQGYFISQDDVGKQLDDDGGKFIFSLQGTKIKVSLTNPYDDPVLKGMLSFCHPKEAPSCGTCHFFLPADKSFQSIPPWLLIEWINNDVERLKEVGFCLKKPPNQEGFPAVRTRGRCGEYYRK